MRNMTKMIAMLMLLTLGTVTVAPVMMTSNIITTSAKVMNVVAPVAMAQEAAASPAAPAAVMPAPPEQVNGIFLGIVSYLQTIPAVGKILALIFQILAIMTPILTVLATLLMAIQGALSAMGKKVPFFTKASDFIGALIPWVKYASNYNTQKKAEEKKA
jgi:hypothetical protein